MSDIDCSLKRFQRVRVGSRNAPKIAAVRAALRPYASGELQVEGAAVESGVPEQPVGFEAIVHGARNRATGAFALLPGCDLAVGIEDGLVEIPAVGELLGSESWLNVGVAVLYDGARSSIGLSSGFAYPPAVAGLAAEKALPIGVLFDRLWRSRYGEERLPDSAASTEARAEASGRREGNIGKLSLGVMTRSEYARHGVLCALVRFLHPDLYPDEREQT